MTGDILLHATGVSKAYDGIRALKDVAFELRAGEVHALVGENGAGKSTLIKILTGAVARDAGAITFRGQPIVQSSPHLAKSLGIVAIYQQPTIFPGLTVAENISFGFEETRPWRRVDWKGRYRRAERLLQQLTPRSSYAPMPRSLPWRNSN